MVESLPVAADAQQRAHFPQFREEFAVERPREIGGAQRSAGALFAADHALDHEDVSSAPEQEAFVELDQVFEQQMQVVKLVLLGVNSAEALHQLFGRIDRE